MEAELKTQASIAMWTLRDVSLASSPFDYIDSALRTIQDIDSAVCTIQDINSAMAPQEQPHAAVELLTSTHTLFTSTHTLSLASCEVAELEMSVGATILIVSRWLEHKADGLQGLPASAWRVRADELTGAVVHAGDMMEEASMHWQCASVVVDLATKCWSDMALDTREAWVQDARSNLASARDRLNDAYRSLVKTRVAAIQARDSGKIMIDLL